MNPNISSSQRPQLLADGTSNFEDLITALEENIADQFSGVNDATPEIEACLKAQREDISAITENTSKYANMMPIAFGNCVTSCPHNQRLISYGKSCQIVTESCFMSHWTACMVHV
jgi:hypothetical protein